MIVLDIALHGDQGPVRVRDISRRHVMSEKYLAKLIQELRKAEIIQSRRGPRGGHVLVRSAESLTVGELVTVLDGQEALYELGPQEGRDHNWEACVHRKIWTEAGQAVLDRLNAITIAQLLAEAKACDNPNCCLRRDQKIAIP